MSNPLEDYVTHVHVDNMAEMQIVRTEEKEPEHFVCSTVVVPQPSAGVGGGQTNLNVTQVCYLNPARKSVAISSPDNPVILCHSYQQAQNPANQVAGVPFPQGTYLPAGGTAALDGTGPLWVVATVAGASRVSVVENVRGEV